MVDEKLNLLAERKKELEAISPISANWTPIKKWHAKTHTLMRSHFPDAWIQFGHIIDTVNLEEIPEITTGLTNPSESRRVGRVRARNDDKISDAYERLLGLIDGELELPRQCSSPPESIGAPESSGAFARIQDLVGASLVSKEFKRAIAQDVKEARTVYQGQAFKACVVMLGAALEGLMLGTLLRADVISHIGGSNSPINKIGGIGTSDPALSEKIAENLGFEQYRTCIEKLVPASANLGVENIQSFRNAIHPWKGIKEPTKYGNIDEARALHYITALEKIFEVLHRWEPN